jgi:uncharacterized damage-inducible protein DinB
MFTVEGLSQLHSWAQGSLGVMLDHTAKLSPEELRKPLDGFGCESVHGTLMHTAEAEDFWVSHAHGRTWESWEHSGGPFGFKGCDTVEEIKARFAEVAARTLDYLAGLRDDELMTPQHITHHWGELDIAPAHMLCHIVTHAFHHKGQVVAMCRILGYPPPETDLA